MLKRFFILLLSCNLFGSTLDDADIKFATGNYIEAIKLYNSLPKKDESVELKLMSCYVRLGDNFAKVDNFTRALSWYKKALDLGNLAVKIKIAKVYTKQANLYKRIKEYKKAYSLYKKALKLGYKKVKKDIKYIDRILNHEKKLYDDPRIIVDNHSPKWTKAIGRLIIPTKLKFVSKTKYKTKYKKCSASLIDDGTHTKIRTIITASHCISGYKEDAGYLKFIIKDSFGNMIQKFATIYKDSHYKHTKLQTTSDYAILILDSFISNYQVKPLISTNIPFYRLKKQYKDSFATLVGFSGDIGKWGEQLTMDPRCKVFKYSKYYGKSNCVAYKGASGGPIVLNVSEDGLTYSQYLVGIVSHFKGNNFKHIYFAPNTQFYQDLQNGIQEYNY